MGGETGGGASYLWRLVRLDGFSGRSSLAPGGGAEGGGCALPAELTDPPETEEEMEGGRTGGAGGGLTSGAVWWAGGGAASYEAPCSSTVEALCDDDSPSSMGLPPSPACTMKPAEASIAGSAALSKLGTSKKGG